MGNIQRGDTLRRKEWTDDELIIAVYLFRFGFDDLGLSYTEISDIMARSTNAIFMKMSNLLSIEGSGPSNIGKRDYEIYIKYKDIPKDILSKQILKILLKMSNQMKNN